MDLPPEAVQELMDAVAHQLQIDRLAHGHNAAVRRFQRATAQLAAARDGALTRAAAAGGVPVQDLAEMLNNARRNRRPDAPRNNPQAAAGSGQDLPDPG